MNTNIRPSVTKAPPLLGDPGVAPDGGDHEFLSINELIAFARRRLRFIVLFVGVITGLTVLYSSLTTKYYSTAAVIVLDRKDTRPFDSIPGQGVTTIDRDRTQADTEVLVILSRNMIGRVVDRFHLVDDPRFNSAVPVPKTLPQDASLAYKLKMTARRTVKHTIDLVRDTTGLDLSFGKAGQELSPAEQRERVISALQAQTGVNRSGETLAISVRVTTFDPKLAADLANGLAEIYVESSLEQKSEPSNQADLTETRSSQSYLVTLRSEEARLVRERAQLAQSYDVNHPRVTSMDSSIASVRNLINLEVQRLGADLQSAAKRPGARIISNATIPTDVAFPRPAMMIAAAAVGSALIAVAIAFVLETTDKRIRSGTRTMRVTGFRHLAYVPLVPRRLGFRRNTFRYLQDRPRSSFSVALRSIYWACRNQKMEVPRQAIMVTSCLPDEGKTSISLGIAHAAALDEKRTVIVDFDFYRPGVLRMLGAEIGGMALDELLAEKCSLNEAVVELPGLPNLHILGLKAPLVDAGRVSSARLKAVIEMLRQNYEFVVIDMPPMLTVDDATWISSLVDGLLMVVRWGVTTEMALADASQQIVLANAPVIGTVINAVDAKVQERHGYGGSVQYHRQAKKYLSN